MLNLTSKTKRRGGVKPPLRLRTLRCALAILLVASSATLFAQSGTHGDNLKWSLSDGTLTISGSGHMAHRASSSDYPWYQYRSQIHTITIREGITSVSYDAFYGYSSVSTLNLPSSIDSIAGDAFRSTGIQTLTLPENLRYFDFWAFKDCNKITTLYYNVKGDGKQIKLPTFTNLTKVVIGDGVTAIPESFCKSSMKLVDVTLGSSVTTIGSHAFYGCTSLVNVDVPASVDSIAGYAFYKTGIRTLTLPENLRYLGSSAFASCDSLSSLYYNVTGDGKNINLPTFKNLTTVVIGDAVTAIPGSFCKGAKLLTDITWGANVDTIRDYAFNGTAITELVIPESVKYIGRSAFCNSILHWKSLELNVSDTCFHGSSFSFIDTLDLLKVGANVDTLDFTRLFKQTLKMDSIDAPSLKSVKSFEHIGGYTSDYSNNELLLRQNLYDIDADGKMEFIKKNDNTVCNNLGFTCNKFSNTRDYYFYNHNNDGEIDIIGKRTSSNGDSVFVSDNIKEGYNPVFNLSCKTYRGAGDINSDGREDLIADGNVIYYSQPDGTFLRTEMSFIDKSAVDSIIYEKMSTTSTLIVQSASQALSFNNVVSAPRPKDNRSVYIFMDIDRNGYTDIINLTNGNVDFNHGENRFCSGNIGGEIKAIKDLNGDGVPDFVLKDGNKVYLLYYSGNGDFVRQLLVSDLFISNAWCYDFDRDGDADILLAFNFNQTTQHSFLVLYRNDGNNRYIQLEQAYTEKLDFMDCCDIDNDGLYEIIAHDKDSKWAHVIKCNEDLTLSFSDIHIDDANEFVSGDFDGDGLIEYNYTSRYDTQGQRGCFFGKFPGTPNTAPDKMEKPDISFNGYDQTVNITWGDGSDRETSAVDLTYAIRIGSAPGQGDILYAHATASGQRLNLRRGNMGNDHSYWFDVSGLPAGDYYIAVQAVDANFKGGAWSDETVYHHNIPGSGFSVSNNEPTTADTLVVSYNGTINPDLTYDWNFGDSAVVICREANRIHLLYNTSGERTITLTVSDSDGNISVESSRTVTVYPCRFDVHNPFSEKSPNISFVFDFDQNGVMDAVCWYNGYYVTVGGFYKNDGNGNLTGLGKIFNLNLEQVHDPKGIGDYNMDGLPDLIWETNKGNVFLNNGADNFTIQTVTSNIFDVSYYDFIDYGRDFNKDGLPDVLAVDKWRDNLHILKNNGGLQFDTLFTFDQKIESLSTYHYKDVYDMNGDGLPDIILCKPSKNYWGDGQYDYNWGYDLEMLENKGNFIFTPKKLLENMTTSETAFAFADMDNDGYTDIIEHSTNLTLTIHHGSANGSYSRTKTIYLPADYNGRIDNTIHTVDIDNNGYLDVALRDCVVYNYGDEGFVAYQDELSFDPDLFADYNGDRTLDLTPKIFNKTRITNEAPAVPANLRVYQTATDIVMEWDDSRDRETPAVQMRYNIGVKKRGASGDNAYIVSPLNGGSDTAAIVPSHIYLRSTRMAMPLSAFEVGGEYELSVQAIDGWNAVSPMSAPVAFTVKEGGGILLTEHEVCSGSDVTAEFIGTSGSVPVWSSDDDNAYIVDSGDGKAVFRWFEAGVKRIIATVDGKEYEASLNVIADAVVDLEFSLPAMALGGAPVRFTLPEVFADPSAEIWFTSELIDDETQKNMVTVQRRGNTLDAIAVFPERDGSYSLNAHCKTKGRCNEMGYTYSQTVTVVGGNITPVISIVSVDAVTGKNVVEWDVPDNVFDHTDLFDKILVYKEGSRTNDFVKLAELPLTANRYIDMSSDPTVRKSRYQIVLGTTYGGESKPSAVHSNVHVMLNKGLQNSVNIIWSKYEGALIEQYTIMRGTSPDSMTVLTTASGHETSYTDNTLTDDVDNYYYAVSYSNTYETEWIQISKAASPARAMSRSVKAKAAAGNVAVGTSNMVSAADRINTVFPKTLNIMAIEPEPQLTYAQSVLHLYPELLPVNATVKSVTWRVTNGGNLASIDDNGVLTYTGNGESGTVTVEATTIDGSALTATRDFTADATVPAVMVESIMIYPASLVITPENNGKVQLKVDVLPDDATDKSVTWSVESTDEHKIVIADDGTVTVRRGFDGSITVTATANDGSGVTATATISTEGLPDYPLTESLTINGESMIENVCGDYVYSVSWSPYEAQPNVEWSIVEGSDMADIQVLPETNWDGTEYMAPTLLLNNPKPGKVVIRATATDGSGVYADFPVQLDFVPLEAVNLLGYKCSHDTDWIQWCPDILLSCDYVPQDADRCGNYTLELIEGSDVCVLELDEYGWYSGIRPTGKKGRAVVRATAPEPYSHIYDDLEILFENTTPQISVISYLGDLHPSDPVHHLVAEFTAYSYETNSMEKVDCDITWSITSGEDVGVLAQYDQDNISVEALGKNGNVGLRATAVYEGETYTLDTVITAVGFDDFITFDLDRDVLTPDNNCLDGERTYYDYADVGGDWDFQIVEATPGVKAYISSDNGGCFSVCVHCNSANGSFVLRATAVYNGFTFTADTLITVARFVDGIDMEVDRDELTPTDLCMTATGILTVDGMPLDEENGQSVSVRWDITNTSSRKVKAYISEQSDRECTVCAEPTSENGSFVIRARATVPDCPNAVFTAEKTVTVSGFTPEGTGVSTVDGNAVTLYPNPVSDLLHISGLKQGSRVTILSDKGDEIKSLYYDGINDFTTDVSDLPAGVYLLRLEHDGSVYSTLKFIRL